MYGRIIISGNNSEKQETQAKTTENSKKGAEKEETDQKKGLQSPTFNYFAPVRTVFVFLMAFAVVVWWWRSRKG